jgi:hypothetical protein
MRGAGARRALRRTHELRAATPRSRSDDATDDESSHGRGKRLREERGCWRDAHQSECSVTSAERSEAREGGVGRSATFRVASPLVMATRRSCGERIGVQCVLAGYATTSCFAGGSATRNDLRHQHRLLRLRSAPPSATSGTNHAKASKLRSRLRAFVYERSITTHLGPLGFTPREAGQSEQVAKQVASAKNRPRASSE